MGRPRIVIQATAGRRAGRVGEWLRRYAPAEVAATLGVVLSAAAVDQFGIAAATAFAATIGEAVAFYSVLFARDLAIRLSAIGSPPTRACSRRRAVAMTLRDLAVEFGPAEALDTLAVRPVAMFVGPIVVGSTTVGVVAGKLAADVVFYALAILSYEATKRRGRLPLQPLGTPATAVPTSSGGSLPHA